MDLFMMVLTTVMIPVFYIWSSRIISMTFKKSGRSIIIKNDTLAEILNAEKILGEQQQISKTEINWWAYTKTGTGQWCEAEQLYWAMAMLYYMIGLSVKVKEGIK